MLIQFNEDVTLHGRRNICCFSGESTPFSKEFKKGDVLSVMRIYVEPRATKRKPRHKDRGNEMYQLLLPQTVTHPDYFEHVQGKLFTRLEDTDGT